MSTLILTSHQDLASHRSARPADGEGSTMDKTTRKAYEWTRGWSAERRGEWDNDEGSLHKRSWTGREGMSCLEAKRLSPPPRLKPPDAPTQVAHPFRCSVFNSGRVRKDGASRSRVRQERLTSQDQPAPDMTKMAVYLGPSRPILSLKITSCLYTRIAIGCSSTSVILWLLGQLSRSCMLTHRNVSVDGGSTTCVPGCEIVSFLAKRAVCSASKEESTGEERREEIRQNRKSGLHMSANAALTRWFVVVIVGVHSCVEPQREITDCTLTSRRPDSSVDIGHVGERADRQQSVEMLNRLCLAGRTGGSERGVKVARSSFVGPMSWEVLRNRVDDMKAGTTPMLEWLRELS
ncbi:hypothetical protein C8F01DRAFT_1081406 [Mycena amicta]|nr:hypothetical protein C8F01DRAFT_1081406 [Mycena amicta]